MSKMAPKSLFPKMMCGGLGRFFWVIRAIMVTFLTFLVIFGHFWSFSALLAPPSKPQESRK